MPVKHPLEYELSPTNIDPGLRWVTLRLRNVGEEDLTALDVRLNSLDAYSISVAGTGLYIVGIHPGEETERAFQVSANLTGRLYASVDGWRGGEEFHWESPGILITVGEEVAELVSLFALTEPYPPPGDKIVCEAIVHALEGSDGRLRIEFWSETPRQEFEELGSFETEPMEPGEEATYRVEFVPEEEGSYAIHAYLYDGAKRLGHEIDYVYVTEP